MAEDLASLSYRWAQFLQVMAEFDGFQVFAPKERLLPDFLRSCGDPYIFQVITVSERFFPDLQEAFRQLQLF